MATEDVFVLSVVLTLNFIIIGAFFRQKFLRYGRWMRWPFALFLSLNALVTLTAICEELASPADFARVFGIFENISIVFAAVTFCGAAVWLHRPLFEKAWWSEVKHVLRSNHLYLFLVAISLISIPVMVVSPFHFMAPFFGQAVLGQALSVILVLWAIVQTDVYLWVYSSKQGKAEGGYTKTLLAAFSVIFILYLLMGFAPTGFPWHSLLHVSTIPPLMAMLYVFSVPTVLEKITPAVEKTAAKSPEFELKTGSYLVKGRGRGYQVFVYQVSHGVPGLCISKLGPKVRERYGLKKTPVVWMSFKKSADALSPLDLNEIKRKVSELGKKAKKGIVFLDSFDVIKTVHGFKKALDFIRDLKKISASSGWTFLVEVEPTIYSSEQITDIERELEVIDVWM